MNVREEGMGEWRLRHGWGPVRAVLGVAACVALTPRARGEQASSMAALEAGCAPGAAPCLVDVTGAVRVQLQGRERFSRAVQLRFGPAGQMVLSGGTLDLSGSSVEAGLGRQVFFGEGAVQGLRTASPDWFGSPEDGVYPAEALRRAYRATVPWGSLYLGRAIYLSPFLDPKHATECAAEAGGVDSPRNLIGAGRPVPDNATAPTRLVGGTVIWGEVCGSGALRLAHLGVDEGPWVSAHVYRGQTAYGVVAESQQRFGKVEGTLLEDVSVLTTGARDMHSVMVEGQRHAVIRGLWIWTPGGTHGLVMKSFDSSVEDLHCRGAAADCLILKSDYATDHAGRASGDTVTGVDIESLAKPGDTGGILLDGTWDALRDVQLRDVRERGLSFGIVAQGSIFHRVSRVLIRNWTATGIEGPCLYLRAVSELRQEGTGCQQAPGEWGPAAVSERPRVFAKGNLRILYTQAVTDLRAAGAWIWLALAVLLAGVFWGLRRFGRSGVAVR